MMMMRSKTLLGKVELTCRNRSSHLPSIIKLIMLRMLMNVMMVKNWNGKCKSVCHLVVTKLSNDGRLQLLCHCGSIMAWRMSWNCRSLICCFSIAFWDTNMKLIIFRRELFFFFYIDLRRGKKQPSNGWCQKYQVCKISSMWFEWTAAVRVDLTTDHFLSQCLQKSFFSPQRRIQLKCPIAKFDRR